MDTFEQIEHCYWSSLGKDPALYGADVCGSITDDDQVVVSRGEDIKCE